MPGMVRRHEKRPSENVSSRYQHVKYLILLFKMTMARMMSNILPLTLTFNDFLQCKSQCVGFLLTLIKSFLVIIQMLRENSIHVQSCHIVD